MSFPNSAGVYDRIIDRSFIVNGNGVLAGGIVISSKKGPVGINTVTSASEFIDLYGRPTMDNPSMYCALRFLMRANILTVNRVVVDAITATGSVPGDVEESEALSIQALSPGAWGNNITVSFEDVADPTFDSFYIVISYEGKIVEKFEVSRDPEAKNGFGSNIFIEEVINNRSRYIRVEDDPSVSGAYADAPVTLTNGQDDTAAPDSATIIDAWDEFSNRELVPAQLLINAGWAVAAIQQKMIAVAKNRRDAVAILDVPEDTASSVSDMVVYRKNILGADSSYGGLYGGWIKIYDADSDREVVIPPSGDVAAVFMHTSEVGERWDAPAGLQRGVIPDAIGVSKVMTEGERDMLYIAGVNPVTAYAGAAAVIWGQKTLQLRASALDRFNVVNSVLWINGRMVQALQPFVFQPNTRFTRDSVNFLLSSFLDDIKKRDGLYDFFVDTSDELNSSTVIDNNQMLVNVFLKPTRTAEFIQLSTVISPTGVELGGSI
jgi:hypothetical protein